MSTGEVPLSTVVDRLTVVYGRLRPHVGVPGVEDQLTLAEVATAVVGLVRGQLMQEHPLVPIAVQGLDDILGHAQAFARLDPEKPCLLHARQIEELALTLEFLLLDPHKYNELRWRWDNFRVVVGIGNRLFTMKEPLHPKMEKWIRDNLSSLRAVKPEFSGDTKRDEQLWRRYGNWLWPRTIKDVFERTGNQDSYAFQGYAWNSHAVHLSPMGEPLHKMQGRLVPFLQFVREATIFRLIFTIGTLTPMAVDAAELRRARLKYVLWRIRRMMVDQPAYAVELMGGAPQGGGTRPGLAARVQAGLVRSVRFQVAASTPGGPVGLPDLSHEGDAGD
jgi:hypothetical protein